MGRIELYRIECKRQNTIYVVKNVDLKSKFRFPTGSVYTYKCEYGYDPIWPSERLFGATALREDSAEPTGLPLPPMSREHVRATLVSE